MELVAYMILRRLRNWGLKLAPEVTQVDPPTNSSAKNGISRNIYGTGSLHDLKTFAQLGD